MELGRKIASYRKKQNITQDALARQLGISNQAVSKWETDQCYPDLELLPRIADIFGVTLDELFDRTEAANSAAEPQTEQTSETTAPFPWANDSKLHAVLFQGHRLILEQELKERFGKICKDFSFCYEGEALDIVSYFNVSCEEVQGSVTAGGYVECENVNGSVMAGSYIECSEVGGDIAAGSYVECGCIGGSVSCGSYIECEDITNGNVSCGSYIECGDITGNVTSGGYLQCGDITGDVSTESNIECGDITGDVSCGGYLECGDIGGNVYRNK